MDSWYTSKGLVDACLARGFHVIGAVKTNRLICPSGIQVPISEYASRHIENSDLHSVTMKDKGRYRIDNYEGTISNIENARVLLSWEQSFSSVRKPFCLLSTDISLDVVTILEYYSIRWEIETAYRYFKEMMGFDHYQLLSFKAIQRYWTIQYLTQNFLELQRVEWSKETTVTFGEAVRKIRRDMFALTGGLCVPGRHGQHPIGKGVENPQTNCLKILIFGSTTRMPFYRGFRKNCKIQD